jgi:DNA modification methylase
MNAVVLPASTPSLPPLPAFELREIGTLVPYARNARTHSPQQVALIAASMDEFGWTNPLLADAKGIVAGHGRVLGAEVLYAQGIPIKFPNGVEIPLGMVPVIDCSGWPETKRRAYIIADNAIALQAGWDVELLKLEVLDLQAADYDLTLLGLGEELTDLLTPGGENERDPDAVPDVPPVPVSKLGDGWQLGPHRVLCGSATDPLAWGTLLGREKVDIIWTDPPYNVNYESKLAGKIKNDSMSDAKFKEFLLELMGQYFAITKEGGAIYVAHADTEGRNFRNAFTEAGFKLSGCLIWRKDSLVLGRSDFQWQHEPILYGWKPGSRHRWYGGRKQTTVSEWVGDPVTRDADGRYLIQVGERVIVVEGSAKIEAHEGSVHFEPKPKRSEDHPTMKPVGLIERHLKNNARAGDIVADGCGGSGSTLIAADRLGMVSRLIELDPRFVDVIVKRWQNYTGRRAIHAQTGEEFPK